LSFFSELKRRNVIRVGVAYIVMAWLIIQVAETIFPLFGFDQSPARVVVIILAVGFIPVLISAWAFELTPEGLKRDSDIDPSHSIAPKTVKKLDSIIMMVLAVALGFFAIDKFVLDPQRDVIIAESASRAGAKQAREEARLHMFSDKSIAVLPFVNRSEKKEDQYFTDGMHDELLTRLSRIAALKVISRTSVMHYLDTEKTIPEIARELSVATILEGGVQRSGNQVRINVQLINAHTDEHMWAEIYDRELTVENLFAIQSEISTVIADALQATLSPEEKTRIYDLPTSSLEAYNHFLRGRQSMASRNREDLEQALGEFEQAAEIDPEFALAWVGIGDASHLLMEAGVLDRFEHVQVHKQAAERALALNDQLGEAYASLSFSYGDSGEYEKSRIAMLKAIELSPNYAQAYHWYANILSRGPDNDEKRLSLLYKAAQLDPLSSIIQMNLAGALLNLGREEEATQLAQRLLQMDPDFAPAYGLMADINDDNGRLAEAVMWNRKGLQLDPGNGRRLLALAQGLVVLGDFKGVADIRVAIDEHLGPGNMHGPNLDWQTFIAQSKWQDAISVLEALPPQAQALKVVTLGYWLAYLNAGDFHKAHQYMMQDRSYISDREQWQLEFTDKNRFACEIPGILIEAGDKALGQDLLQLFLQNFKAVEAGQNPHAINTYQWIVCYLVDGLFDQALDILERETAQGRLLDRWWLLGKIPWWEQLEDNPRYIALVNRIETRLAEQRKLLKEMEEAGSFVP
jgi:TolB-like protein/cytochrome c-type biogenesis protein CcmH/NrfG